MKNLLYCKLKPVSGVVILLTTAILLKAYISAATVYTPLGSPVTATYSTVQWNPINDYDRYIIESTDTYNQINYPDAISIRDWEYGRTYNCHSYAWHSQSIPNYYLIIIPAVYISDGSYSLVASTYGPDRYTIPSGIRAYANKVYYGDPDDNNYQFLHSGITVPNTTNYVLSKWYHGRLYKHYVWDCPYYNDTNATYYYR